MKYLKYLFMLIMLFSIDVYADNYSVDFNKKGKLNITLTDKEENLIKELKESAVQNYEKYLELNPNAQDKADVEQQIQKLTQSDNQPVQE